MKGKYKLLCLLPASHLWVWDQSYPLAKEEKCVPPPMSCGTPPTQHTEQQQNLPPRKEWLTAGGEGNRCREYIYHRTCLCSRRSKAPEGDWMQFQTQKTQKLSSMMWQHPNWLLNNSLNTHLAYSHQGFSTLLHSGCGTLASSESI